MRLSRANSVVAMALIGGISLPILGGSSDPYPDSVGVVEMASMNRFYALKEAKEEASRAGKPVDKYLLETIVALEEARAFETKEEASRSAKMVPTTRPRLQANPTTTPATVLVKPAIEQEEAWARERATKTRKTLEDVLIERKMAIETNLTFAYLDEKERLFVEVYERNPKFGTAFLIRDNDGRFTVRIPVKGRDKNAYLVADPKIARRKIEEGIPFELEPGRNAQVAAATLPGADKSSPRPVVPTKSETAPSITRKYDKFSDETTVASAETECKFTKAAPVLSVNVSVTATFKGQTAKEPPGHVTFGPETRSGLQVQPPKEAPVGAIFMLEFSGYSTRGRSFDENWENITLIMLSDNERIRLKPRDYHASKEYGHWLEIVAFFVESKELGQMADAKKLEAQFGEAEFVLPADFQELARRVMNETGMK